MKKLKTALVHEYLNQYGGAEKTLESLIDIFPNSKIYTGIYKKGTVSPKVESKEIISSPFSRNPILKKLPKYFTFLMPVFFENFDLREFDLVFSDGTAWPKSVLTTPEQLHISYIHTPPRFLYKYSVESKKRDKWYFKPIVSYIENWLRVWDYEAAQRPDYLIANSKEVQKRIKKFYGRQSTVIYPPVEVDKAKKFKVPADNLRKPFYCIVGRLSHYKNVHLVIEAFNLLGLELVVIGTGMEEKSLKKLAGKSENIRFLGKVSEEEKHKTLSQCLGVIFPVKDEDFGIVPVEAMSHGKPVLAHKSGGPLETVLEDKTGMFFDEINLDNFVSAMKIFDEKVRKNFFDPSVIIDHAEQFNEERFKNQIKQFVSEKLTEHRQKYA